MKKLYLTPLALLLVGLTSAVFASPSAPVQPGPQGFQNLRPQGFQKPGPQGLQNPGGFHGLPLSRTLGQKRTTKPNRIKMINNKRLS